MSVAFALFTEGYRKTAVADLPARLVFSSYATLPQTVTPQLPGSPVATPVTPAPATPSPAAP